MVDEHAEQAVDELSEALRGPLLVEDFPVTIEVSIGVAQAPADGRTSRDLLRAADVAMYKAKRTGAAVVYYETCVKGPQRGRLNLLGDLGDALTNHEMYIHFQPQLRLADGEVDTVEALIRWQHPEHGPIPPDEFIGLAEQTDLIVPITELVLRIATQGLLNSGVTAHLAVTCLLATCRTPISHHRCSRSSRSPASAPTVWSSRSPNGPSSATPNDADTRSSSCGAGVFVRDR